MPFRALSLSVKAAIAVVSAAYAERVMSKLSGRGFSPSKVSISTSKARRKWGFSARFLSMVFCCWLPLALECWLPLVLGCWLPLVLGYWLPLVLGLELHMHHLR